MQTTIRFFVYSFAKGRENIPINHQTPSYCSLSANKNLFLYMRLHFFLTIASLSGLSLFASCKSQSSCENNEPVAIFQPDIPEVLSHSFRTTQNGETLETLSLKDHFSLELWQSNCHSTRQEFRFSIPLPDSAKEGRLPYPQIVQLAAAQFHRLSLLGPSYQPFNAWAQTISAQQQNFLPGRPLEVDTGIFITIDGLNSRETLQIVVKLEQRDPDK